VLGQGTFGQVVKCQNLKTQEVVAVKVVKNRTAYFNQSMMEVSVLDLVQSLVKFVVKLLLTFPSLMENLTKMTIITSFDSKIPLFIDSIYAWFSNSLV
jgi:serine/threonine protein kinase